MISFCEFRRPRRYYLMRRRTTAELGYTALSVVWQSKQEAEAGALLPVGFPSKSTLEANGYIAIEDIDGADATELRVMAGLDSSAAQAVITQAAALI